ncbi:hypothetical protein ACEWY4_016977 [Coilia grayii]|uniref:Myosin X N-terminal SH3 domain-containing protein n=1 Tax=Coilia grayii TaxID=363190 RepID=A0ABD1JMW1_9TELE
MVIRLMWKVGRDETEGAVRPSHPQGSSNSARLTPTPTPSSNPNLPFQPPSPRPVQGARVWVRQTGEKEQLVPSTVNSCGDTLVLTTDYGECTVFIQTELQFNAPVLLLLLLLFITSVPGSFRLSCSLMPQSSSSSSSSSSPVYRVHSD